MRLIALVSIFFAACSSSPEQGGSGGGGATGAAGGSSSGQEIMPRHIDASMGCGAGHTACDRGNFLACTDLDADDSNCGACGTVCDRSENLFCINGSCSDAGTSCYGTLACDGECASGNDPRHCGLSCGNRCGERELCHAYQCEGGGSNTGARCDSPLVITPQTLSSYGMYLGGALTGQHTFSCGPSRAVPTRWLRATVSGTDFSLQVGTDGDAILELVEAPCPAGGPPVAIACNDNSGPGERSAWLNHVPVVHGKTYLIAVGFVSGAPTWAGLQFY